MDAASFIIVDGLADIARACRAGDVSASTLAQLALTIRPQVEHALDNGSIMLTDDQAAVAVWAHCDHGRELWWDGVTNGAEFPEPFGAMLEAATTAMRSCHPDVPHRCLQFLSVREERRREGRGAALLAHEHARLARAALPAFTVAMSRALEN